MIRLSTPVQLPSQLLTLDYESHMLVLGSCFADNMGERMQRAKLPCMINPFGTLYNPISILNALERLRSGKSFTSDGLFQHQGLWHSRMHHGAFSNADQEQTLTHINEEFGKAVEFFPKVTCIVVTLGSAYVYKDAYGVVANCHKLPASDFVCERLTVDEIVEAWIPWVGRAQFLFSVSPIRHLRDGLHMNQLSKSTLLLAIDKLQQLSPATVHYFPSYEIVNDELRDYRFYAEDMTHPSIVAENYIWEKFTQSCFTADTQKVMAEVERITKALEHRPLHPDSCEYHDFLNKLLLNIKQLKEKYPYLDVSKEINKICCIR